MTIQKATNITWHDGDITKLDRERFIQQKGVVIWFTGLSSSGKSTIARAVEERLFERGHLSYVPETESFSRAVNLLKSL